MLQKLHTLLKEEEKEKRKGRKNKAYARAEFPGQKVQVDVKFVPSYCVADGKNTINIPLLTSAADIHSEKCMMNIVRIVQ